MPVRSRKKGTRSVVKKTNHTSDSSSSDTLSFTYTSTPFVYDESSQDVVRWGYLLLFICWIIFVGGIGGLLGLWDRVMGFSDGRIMEAACCISLVVVTGFIWTVLNWYVFRSRHTPWAVLANHNKGRLEVLQNDVQ